MTKTSRSANAVWSFSLSTGDKNWPLSQQSIAQEIPKGLQSNHLDPHPNAARSENWHCSLCKDWDSILETDAVTKTFCVGHISHELIHHKIIPVPFRQPSTVFQPTGDAGEADHVEPGSVPSSLTCNWPTLASTRRGFAHKVVRNGVQLWRRLCSPLGVMMMMMIWRTTK